MKYVTLEEVLAIHHYLLQETGGSSGIRDLNLLQSAVARPRASFGGKDLYPSIWLKVAALIQSLILNHPFVDGNKRTAFTAGVRFLKVNGIKFQAEQKAIIDFVLAIEKKEESLKEIATWLKKHSKKIRQP